MEWSCPPDDGRPVEEFQDAGAVHGATGGGPGRGGEVLPRTRRGMSQEAEDDVGSSPSQRREDAIAEARR